MQLSDIVDVVGLTPVPSPAPSTDPTDSGRIRCVCGSEEDDGFTIQCDSCLVWQHAVCVGIARNNVPEVYLCEECRPDVDVEASGGRRKRGIATVGATISTASKDSLMGLNEISGNIVATEAQSLLSEVANEVGVAKQGMLRLPKDLPLGQVNFELCQTVVFPSVSDIRNSTKLVEVRELRPRTLGGRRGSAAVRLGVFSREDIDPGAIIGEYFGHVQPISILSKRTPLVENVTQSLVLFSNQTPDLVVDARRFGNSLRYIRRSCRANCKVKLVLVESDDPIQVVHWCLFARNTIRENEELYLPFDYSDGNQYFRYECCCSYPELCLADDMPSSLSSAVASISSTSLPSTNASATSIRKKPGADRKLSREERKLQQYIEFIERMESAEKKSARRGVAGTSGSASGSPPPQSSKRGSPKSSPAKEDPNVISDVIPLSSSPTTATPSSPLGSPSRALPLKKMLSKTFSDRSRHSSLDSPIKVKSDPNLESHGSRESHGSHDMPGITAESSAHASSGTDSGEIDIISAPSTSNPETPSKKRVSLSDYLSRRKSSPAGGPKSSFTTFEPETRPSEQQQQTTTEESTTNRLWNTLSEERSHSPFSEDRPHETGTDAGLYRPSHETDIGMYRSQSNRSPYPSPLGPGDRPPVRYQTPPPDPSSSSREYDRWSRSREWDPSSSERRPPRRDNRFPLFADGGREDHRWNSRDRSERDSRERTERGDSRDRPERGDTRDRPERGDTRDRDRDYRDHHHHQHHSRDHR